MFFSKPKQEALTVTSDAFKEGGKIPLKYTGRAEDLSPELKLSAVSEKAKSIAVILDDLDVPGMGILTHWVIWNLPVQNFIPENIPHGENRSVFRECGAGDRLWKASVPRSKSAAGQPQIPIQRLCAGQKAGPLWRFGKERAGESYGRAHPPIGEHNRIL